MFSSSSVTASVCSQVWSRLLGYSWRFSSPPAGSENSSMKAVEKKKTTKNKNKEAAQITSCVQPRGAAD